MKISNSFVTGFYKCKKLAFRKPEDLENLEVPLEMQVALGLEAKIVEKRPDAHTILQLIMAEELDVLAKREKRLPTPNGPPDNEGNEQEQEQH